MAGASRLGVFVTLLCYAASKSVPVEKRSEVCYGDLGCFGTGGPFTSLHRPLSLTPQSPSTINARFLLFTRQNRQKGTHQFLNANNYNSITTSNFQSERPTKVVSHGFLENGFVDWMDDMKNELLQQGDYNVILLDWGGGSGLPYTQATANTRVVGAELAKLIKVLQTHASAKPADFHLIGHSLGAHICGYAGARTTKIGRISGLDPADPYFQGTDTAVRLDPSDATFVDIMHTNGASILKLGYGMIQPCGHVDYFPNAGEVQPGCDKGPIDQIRTEGDIFNGGKEFVACSHLRAYKYFTESINSQCPFMGYSCSSFADFQRGLCLPCTGGECGYMGFHADKVKPRSGQTHVQYYLKTGNTAPFCRYHYQIDVQFGQLPLLSKTETGTLFMNLIGKNGQLGERQITASPLEVHPGHTYGFMVTSTHDIGDITQISFRWSLDSHWYNPLTWSAITHHGLRINAVDVVNGEDNNRSRFCGFNTEVQTDTTRTFSSKC